MLQFSGRIEAYLTMFLQKLMRTWCNQFVAKPSLPTLDPLNQQDLDEVPVVTIWKRDRITANKLKM